MAEYKGAAKEGARAMTLIKKREKMKEEMEAMKRRLLRYVSFDHRLLYFRTLYCETSTLIRTLS